MEKIKSYEYAARDDNSYNRLAAYAINTPATVTLHPGLAVIVISEIAKDEVDKYIRTEGLDVTVRAIEVHDENLGEVIDSETTDSATLRSIIYKLFEQRGNVEMRHRKEIDDLTAQRDDAKERLENYKKWWNESESKYQRVKGQVKAISTLMNEVFPEK